MAPLPPPAYPGDGLFAELLKKNGILVRSEEDMVGVKTFCGSLPLSIKPNPPCEKGTGQAGARQGLEVVTPNGFSPHLVPDILEEKRGWIERTPRQDGRERHGFVRQAA